MKTIFKNENNIQKWKRRLKCKMQLPVMYHYMISVHQIQMDVLGEILTHQQLYPPLDRLALQNECSCNLFTVMSVKLSKGARWIFKILSKLLSKIWHQDWHNNCCKFGSLLFYLLIYLINYQHHWFEVWQGMYVAMWSSCHFRLSQMSVFPYSLSVQQRWPLWALWFVLLC